jgi:hypothetical protein
MQILIKGVRDYFTKGINEALGKVDDIVRKNY